MPRRKAAIRLPQKKSSDSDSIDVESTEISEIDEGKDYVVECILAEDEDIEGKMFYLLKWEDYSILRSTWEPSENIKDQSTFDEWKDQKERIEKGLAKPFDVVKFGEELEQEGKAKALRHKRREQKRKRLGLTKSSSVCQSKIIRPASEEVDSDSSSEAQEVNEDLEEPPSIPSRTQRRNKWPTLSRATDSEDIDAEEALPGVNESTRSRPRRRHNIPVEDIDISDDSLVEELGKRLAEKKVLHKAKPTIRKTPEKELDSVSNGSESMSSRDASPRRLPQNTTQQRKRLGAEAPSHTGYLGTANRGINISNTSSRGRGAAATRGSHRGRGGWRSAGSALNFTIGNTASTGGSKRPRGLATAILNAAKVDSNKPKQHFTTPSMVRKAELASRSLADRVLDVDFIGPLIKPSEYNMSRLRKKSISSKLSFREAQSGEAGSDEEAEPLQPSLDSEEAATHAESAKEDTQMRELPSWTPRGPRNIVNEAASILATTNSENPEFLSAFRGNSTSTSFTAPQQVFHPPKPITKVRFSEYVNRRVLESFGDAISIQVVFGDKEVLPILVAFKGTNKNDQDTWVPALGGLEKAPFTRACVAQDFQAHGLYSQSQVLASGDIATDSNGSQIIQEVAERLRPLFGLVFNHNLFNVLVYPAKCEEWKFIDTNTNYDSNSPLLYQIFRSLPNVIGETSAEAIKDPVSMIELDRNYLESLLSMTQSLQYGRLVPILTEPNKSHNFYLLFPPRVSSSVNVFASWLRACDPKCRIYTNQKPGSWDFFTNNPDFNTGTVLIHQSLLPSISKIPRLAEMMDIKQQYFFWCFGDSSSPNLVNRSLGSPMVQLFPQGGAIFLTPSFLKSQPKRTNELLVWFQEKLSRATPGTWKLVVSHNCRDYLLDLALKRASVAENLHENFMTEQKSVASNRSNHRRGKIEFLNYQIFDKLMKQELMAGYPFNWDSNTPDNAECPVVYADESLNPEDEIGLVTWFALWSVLHLHLFRKFIVVGTALSRVKSKTSATEETFGTQTREELTTNGRANTMKQKNNQPQAIENRTSKSNAYVPQLPANGWKRNAFVEVKASSISSPQNKHATPETNMSKPVDVNIHESVLYFIVITGADKATASYWVEKFNNDAITAAKHYAREQQGKMQVDGVEDDADASAILNFAGTYESGPGAPIIPSIANEDLMRAMELYHIGYNRSRSSSGRLPNYDGPDDTHAARRTQPSSRSGIVTDEDKIRRFVPPSNRPSGTTRPEISIRPGYVSPEDRKVYRNCRNVGGVPLYEHEDIPSRDGSKSGSSVQSPADAAAEARQPSVLKNALVAVDAEELLGLAKESGERQTHSVPEVEMTISELELPQTPIDARKSDVGETTMEWYGRMCKEGKSWEHIYVKDWETCFKVLGIQVTSK